MVAEAGFGGGRAARGVGAFERRRAGVATAVLSPWLWFVARPIGGLVDFAAIALPIVVCATAGACVLVALRIGRWWPALVALSCAAMGVVAVVGPWMPASGPPPLSSLSVVTANLEAERAPELVDALLQRRPDVLVVNELHVAVDAALTERFRYREVSRLVFTARGVKVNGTPNNRAGVGIYSDLPITLLPDPTGLPEGLPGLRVEVAAPGGPFVLYALHLSKASPLPDGFSTTFAAQRTVAERVLDSAAREDLPVVVAGDLNISDRQELYRSFRASFTDAMRDGWAGPTSAKENLLWRSLLLRIDHVFHSPGLCSDAADRFALPTSDHRGLAVDVGPCPPR